MSFSNTLVEDQVEHLEENEVIADSIETENLEAAENEFGFAIVGSNDSAVGSNDHVEPEYAETEFDEAIYPSFLSNNSDSTSDQIESEPKFEFETSSGNESITDEPDFAESITDMPESIETGFAFEKATDEPVFDESVESVEPVESYDFEQLLEKTETPASEFLSDQYYEHSQETSSITNEINETEISQDIKIPESETPEFDSFFSELLKESFFDESADSNKTSEENELLPPSDIAHSTHPVSAETAAGQDSDWAEYAETVGQIGSIKTLDQIFFGIEKDQLKIQVKPFDSLALNLALHEFRNGNLESKEKVFDEILKWQEYLLERDENIGLKDLRIHCETAKPALNSKALLTLAEFYQNVSRSKFEMLLTRVFSKLTENSKRRLIVETADLEQHIVNIFSKGDQSSQDKEVRESVIFKCAHFREQATECQNFGGLVGIELLKHYSEFKKELGSEFHDSKVLTTIIETNVFIGNRFVTLLVREKSAPGSVNLQNKVVFGSDFENEVSETICQSIYLDKITAEEIVRAPRKVAKPLESAKERSDARQKRLAEADAKNGVSTAKLAVYAIVTGIITLIVIYVLITYLMEYGLTE